MKSNVFYTAEEIANILSVSKPTAYRIIRELNAELHARGFITVAGRIPRKYFEEKFYC